MDNILMNNKISYKVISPYQKIENDKERIKSKFNFNISRTSTNSSVFMHSSLNTQKNSMIFQNKNTNIKNRLLQQKEKQLNITNYRPKSTINMNNNRSKNISIVNSQSKISELSNKNKHNKLCNLTYGNCNTDIKESKPSSYKKKNNTNHSNIQNINQIYASQILNNITYNNYYNYINDNSLTVLDNQNYFLQDSILKTQSILDGLNDYNSKFNNYTDIDNNYYNKIEKEKREETEIDNGIYESFNKSSFSGSSKTSEMQGDILNIQNNNNNNSANEGDIQIVNNENYVIKKFNGINRSVDKVKNKIDEEEEMIQQILKPFTNDNSERRKTEVNTFGLLDDDEYNQENRKKMLNNSSNYYFIEDIIKKNNSYISLSFDKFKSINNKAKYKIFSFIYDDFKNLLNSSIYMRNIIKDMLEEEFTPYIKDFENKYKSILLIDNYQFNIHEFVKSKLKKKKFTTFCLYIKAKVLPNNEYFIKYGDICFEISYKYKIRSLKNDYNIKSNRTNISYQSYVSKDHIQEEYIQIYKFDLRKNKNYPMWLCSERDELFNNASRNLVGGINSILSRFLIIDDLYQKHLIYSSPIINVNENDYIIFRINLIENNNIIENISFNEPIVQSVTKNYYHKIGFKQEQKFDKMRDCENEIAINIWHDDYTIKNYNKNNINYEEFICKLKKIFQEYFEIKETKFDISKFVFIRMTMKAKKIGILKSNVFSNKDIEIVDKNTSLVKECTPINAVNTFSLNKHLTIKQGTIIDFYLME